VAAPVRLAEQLPKPRCAAIGTTTTPEPIDALASIHSTSDFRDGLLATAIPRIGPNAQSLGLSNRTLVRMCG